MASIEELFAALPRQSWAGGPPPLIVMAGLPASGKSFTAHLLAAHLGLTHVSADQVRMHITGSKPRYSAREGARTSAEAAKLMRSLLKNNVGVVIDSVGLTRRARSRYLRAAQGKTVIIWCEVDEAIAAELFEIRATAPGPWDFSRADAAERARIMRVVNLEAPHSGEADLVVRLTSRQADALLAQLCREFDVQLCAVHLAPAEELLEHDLPLVNAIMEVPAEASLEQRKI